MAGILGHRHDASHRDLGTARHHGCDARDVWPRVGSGGCHAIACRAAVRQMSLVCVAHWRRRVHALLAGFSVPTQRTLAMLLVGLGCTWLRRAPPASQVLSIALIAVLLIDHARGTDCGLLAVVPRRCCDPCHAGECGIAGAATTRVLYHAERSIAGTASRDTALVRQCLIGGATRRTSWPYRRSVVSSCR